MRKLSESDILQLVHDGEAFECSTLDGAFTLKIEAYTPAVCVAVHAGHRMRAEVEAYCALDEQERRYEEDPFTDQFIQAMPITLVANDSRYEYDLNRPLATCIYKKAWGKEVWCKNLPARERGRSTDKHRGFYRVLDAVVAAVEHRFGACLVFDVHSYNFLRRDTNTPTFNLGTEQIDCDRWGEVLEHLLAGLRKIELPNMPVVADVNKVFYGRGYMIAHINSRFENTLVVPLEVKKIYMDELEGEPYPLVLQALNQQLKNCLADTAAFFSRRHTRKRRVKRADMLAEKLDPAILRVDRALYQLAKGLETLHYINPINIQSERKKFFSRHGNYRPNFQYRQLDIDPYQFREQLYRLPVDTIRDPGIQLLYRDVIDALSDKINLLVKAGQPQFVYESLKYYGEPSLIDEQNAGFILHATDFDQESETRVSTPELVAQFMEAAARWGMQCKVELSNRLVASAMVSNARKTVLISKGLELPAKEAAALVHHELGVHMATTLNATGQRLKVFSLGLPGNTLTQEGLAILNEFHSGNMSLKRLKGLAMRVLAVKEMLKQGDFRHTFAYLIEEHHMTAEDAFKLATRVHRGGGFTKDHLYLRGISEALSLSRQRDIRNLYIGKTGFAYLPIIDEMVTRQLIESPVFVPEYLSSPIINSPILDYLMCSIKHTLHPQNVKTYEGHYLKSA